jgi:septal ring factor EnvC (AmiA/AmiB activator)
LTQFSRVETAIEDARVANASVLAPVELRIAEESLAVARGLQSKRGEGAQHALELAAVNAELARVKSTTADLRQQVSRAERELNALKTQLLKPEQGE